MRTPDGNALADPSAEQNVTTAYAAGVTALAVQAIFDRALQRVLDDGMDPEISSGASNSAYDRGVDHSTIPNLKAYQVTLNLGF